MSLPVSPIKKLTKLDRTQSKHLYRAVDTQGERPRYLHISGDFLTLDKVYSWSGTKSQFERICKEKEWDALKLIPRS